MLWHEPTEHATYSQIVELDLGDVEPSIAGPRRPQDRVPLATAKRAFIDTLGTFGVDYANGDDSASPTRSLPPIRRPSSSPAARRCPTSAPVATAARPSTTARRSPAPTTSSTTARS